MDSEPAASIAPQLEAQYSNNSSNASTPSDGQKKRKYEEATRDEKWELYQHHSLHPHLKQRELAEWFSEKYGKQINQSTVSRNLKKFKIAPPTKPGTLPEIAPRKRERKQSCSQSPPQQKIERSEQLKYPPSAISLPPTPPPRDSRQSPIDAALWGFYSNYRQLHPGASETEITEELKTEAQKLFSSIRPPPPPEKIDQQLVDDEWVSTWKRNHGIPPPSSPFNNLSPRPAPSVLPLPKAVNSQSEDRTSSEETEPRSPVSAVSSNENRVEEHSAMKALLAATESHSHMQRGQGIVSDSHASVHESPEKRRKKEIKKLRRDVEKRDLRIQKETMRKNEALRCLEELEKQEKQENIQRGFQTSGNTV